MVDEVLRFDLSRQHIQMFLAHIFVYLVCQDSPGEGPLVETIKEIGSRFFALDSQGSARASFLLTTGEVRALKLMFRSLVQCYCKNPPSLNRARALRDLTICRALLQRAKRLSVQKEES
jgi:hypothetical protein